MAKYGDITDVGVVVYIDIEQRMRPLFIVWEDINAGSAKKYKIDKIVQSAEIIPGHFVWNVVIQNKIVNLHYSDGKWYTVRGVNDVWVP